MTKETFLPPPGLRNGHVQSTLASLGPRKWLARRRARPLLDAARPVLLDGGAGVRLSGALSLHPAPKRGLALLLHGWEGSQDSAYLLSVGGYLYDRGFSVLRLNFRDHGDSHDLNRDLFLSTRLDEVVNALASAARLHPHDRVYLAGFSLGGNFALRVALAAPGAGLTLRRAAAVCPVIDPAHAMRALEGGVFVYRRYFLAKWKRSLRRKDRLFPDLGLSGVLDAPTLTRMHERMLPVHSPYKTPGDYFAAYALTGRALAGLETDTLILASADDPVIPASDFSSLAPCPRLRVELAPHGGHCGFLEGPSLTSWADRRLEHFFV